MIIKCLRNSLYSLNQNVNLFTVKIYTDLMEQYSIKGNQQLYEQRMIIKI